MQTETLTKKERRSERVNAVALAFVCYTLILLLGDALQGDVVARFLLLVMVLLLGWGPTGDYFIEMEEWERARTKAPTQEGDCR